MTKTFVISYDWDDEHLPNAYSTGLFVHQCQRPQKPVTGKHFFVQHDIINWIKLKAAQWIGESAHANNAGIYLNISVHEHEDPALEYSAPGAGPFDASYKVSRENNCFTFTLDTEYCISRGGKIAEMFAVLGDEFQIDLA